MDLASHLILKSEVCYLLRKRVADNPKDETNKAQNIRLSRTLCGSLRTWAGVAQIKIPTKPRPVLFVAVQNARTWIRFKRLLITSYFNFYGNLKHSDASSVR